MEYFKIQYNQTASTVQIGLFNSNGNSGECHAMIELSPQLDNTIQQFERLGKTIEELIQSSKLRNYSLVLKRYFLSDAINQAPFIKTTANEAVSVVQQPPLNGTKVSVWLYFIENTEIYHSPDGTVSAKRPGYTHLYNTQLHERIGDVNRQTDAVFGHYTQNLAEQNCSLEANCIRTWIYVQDVDVQYMGMVNYRKYYFMEAGLTPETHYIASTGIEGRYIYPEVLMLMDAYAIPEVKKEQITYLHAPTHLNPTYEYGVTFERGTAVDYGDRRHIFISGTASIDNKGEIVHPMDIDKQTDRTLENIGVLLEEGGMTMQDIAQMIVYLRDTADYEIVKSYIEKYYPNTPSVIVLAPVCRPGWLIEIECIAVKAISNDKFPAF